MKRKLLYLILVIISLVGLIYINSMIRTNSAINNEYTYSPEAAINYSYKYVKKRNPKYANFENNCVNYVSQCLVAGGLKMSEEKIAPISRNKVIYSSNKWFSYGYENDLYKPYSYCFSSAFTHNYFFIKYWRDIENIPYGTISNTQEEREKLKEKIKVGDIIILHSSRSHAAIIVDINENGIYYNSNTKDRETYPLSFVSERTYKSISYFNFVK